jgi:hypothetical protein
VPPSTLDASANIKYFFFATLINGRRKVSWGADLGKNRSGRTDQALFEPGDQFEFTDKDGRTMIQPGIESRRFYFLPKDKESTSVAEDGGVIEVRAFRAYGRSPRSPNTGQYRDGDKYGIG